MAPTVPAPIGNWTLEFWWKGIDTNPHYYIGINGNGAGEINSDVINFTPLIYDGVHDKYRYICDQKWHHVAFVANAEAGVSQIFVDGWLTCHTGYNGFHLGGILSFGESTIPISSANLLFKDCNEVEGQQIGL